MRAPIDFLNAVSRPRFHPKALAAISLLALAGCAQQQQPGYYEPAKESTLSDARSQAQGRQNSRAPSQLQLGFGNNETEQNTEQAAEQTDESQEQDADASESAEQANVIRPLREPKTFLGTLPCNMTRQLCSASRFTLTLAPSGEWRARAQPLDGAASGQPLLEQGCWKVIGTEPWRIRLETDDETTLSALTFEHNNLLRVNSMNTVQASLPFHLTRQADIDGIDELNDQPAMRCRP
tara:strand:- start:2214 stop:2924 length:711 start_codon:yes stop_codon:yes gene_type:complete